MRYKIITLIAVFLMGLLLIPQFSEAAQTVAPSHHAAVAGHSGSGHSGSGHSGSGKTVLPYPPNYHGGHSGHGYYDGGHYHGGYYGHYGWPYWGWGGYYPYFGLGFYYGYPYGWGYPYYGYGYGYGYGYPYYAPAPGYYGYPTGSVRTEVKPQSAQVFVDGGYVGKADDYDGWWQRLDLEPGQHRLVFRAPGFQPYVADIRIVPGQDVHLKYDMVAGNDTIDQKDMMLPRSDYDNRGYRQPYDRRYPPDQRDQQYQRRPPEDHGQYQPMPDENQPPENNDNDQGYYGDDQYRNENRDQRPLVLHVEPSDATVYVDGNYYGTSNDNGRNEIQVLLPPGNHKIEVVRPGYESFSQDIMVSKDQDNHVNVILRKK